MRIVPIRWRPFHNQLLAVSAGEDLAGIRRDVIEGRAVLWQCESGDKGGFVVTRVDDGELVVVLGEGSGADVFIPFFIEYASARGLTVRTHVTRKGLIKIWGRHGVKLSEYVLRG